MAQLTDIIVKAMLPLHPRLAASPRLSIQLILRGNVVEETNAVIRHMDGVWEATSALKLPDGDEPLTLVINEQNDNTNLILSTFNPTTLRALVNARPDEYHQIIAYKSLTQMRVSIFYRLTILKNSPPEAFSSGCSPTLNENRAPSLTWMTMPLKQEALEKAYADYTRLPNSEEKVEALSKLGYAYQRLYRQSLDPVNLDHAISIQREAIQLEHSHPQLARRLRILSSALENRYYYSGNYPDIDEAIQLSQNALNLTRRDAPERAECLMQLASSHGSRFKRLGGVADIDMAVSTYSEALALMPKQSPNKVMGHNNFALTLLERFEHLGDLANLDAAISNLENVMKLTPDGHPSKHSYYNNLGNALKSRFKFLGNLTDLETAISHQENAVSLTPAGDPDEPWYYNNLGHALQLRYRRLGDPVDLNKAISNHEKATSLIPDEHPDKPQHYNNFGNSLQSRFEYLGNLADLEMAISSQENAVNLTPDGHPDKPMWYNSLGIILVRRFERLGNVADLDRAVSSQENAVSLTPDEHPDKSSWYYCLGNSLIRRFNRLGNIADLDRAVSNQENALSLAPDGHPDRGSWYNSLGAVFRCRFERLGNLADLERAIFNIESAMNLTPDGHTSKPFYCSSLADALHSRYGRLRDIADLERAIANLEHAMSLKPDGHLDKGLWYENLGSIFLSRYERLGNPVDLERAISNRESAVNLTPDGHSEKAARYDSLGISLQAQFELLGDLTDLQRIISNQQNAVNLTPDGHPSKPWFHNHLGLALRSRFERLGDLEDLEGAISNSETAVILTPDGHPDKVYRTFNLAYHYEGRFTSFANRSDLEIAHSLYATAAQSHIGRPRQRFEAASAWSRSSKLMNTSPLPAFKCAIDQLPQIAWHGISVSEQHSSLKGIGWWVREAVAAAIEAEEYDMAVEWAEQGRSIVWRNLLNLRTPADDLRAAHPELANQLQSISQQLGAPRSRELVLQLHEDAQPQEVAKSHTSLAIDWDATVAKIKKLPDFGSFLMPKRFENLVPAAHKGPVVIFNVTKHRCDALALIYDDNGVVSTVHIPLENCSLLKSVELLVRLKALLTLSGVRDGDTRTSRRVSVKANYSAMFKSILRTLWVDLVKPVIDGLKYQPGTNELPRIWWCAMGPLAFLPIHAAGDYDATNIGHKLSDYVMSSYTPTLAALLDSSYPNPSRGFKLLTVAQPSAPGLSEIPKTMDEVEQIEKIATGISVVGLAKENATVERVRKGMKESNWVHLACHGKQDAAKPIESGLILYDGTLKLSTIVKESLPNAEFAFLSACQTAMGDEEVAEESVHLAAGMLLAGYRGVIATMWSIKDDVAPRVAEVVYGRMLKGGKPNREEAAYALHEAVKQLRESGADFASWVPFIHIGR